MKEKQHITIIGAGLAGSLFAIYMAKRGFDVEVYEKRADMRKNKVNAGRSINLALSHRGIKALEKIGIAEEVLQNAIPMYGRMIHTDGQKEIFVPYGIDKTEHINSISRAALNVLLMNIAERYANVKFFFDAPVKTIDSTTQTIYLQDGKQINTDIIIGADGAGSVVRKHIVDTTSQKDDIDFLNHGYKELTIPAKNENEYFLEENALHIWPRKMFMLIALPNMDKSFTCTLFLAKEGEESFQALDSAEKIQAFFEKHFSDALPYLKNLQKEFKENPVGPLGTVKTYPWVLNDNVVLIGDAAHAIVPFYGQGMNASFEDCLVLDNCIDEYLNQGWNTVFSNYQDLRKVNGDSIGELAIENYYEMRDGVAEPAFLLKKELEHKIEQKYPDYHSKYSLVTFHPEIPYAEAQKRGNLQNDFLLNICRKVKTINDLNIDQVYQNIQNAID